MAMTQMALFLTGGELDAAKCTFQVPPPVKRKQGRFRRRVDDLQEEVSYQILLKELDKALQKIVERFLLAGWAVRLANIDNWSI